MSGSENNASASSNANAGLSIFCVLWYLFLGVNLFLAILAAAACVVGKGGVRESISDFFESDEIKKSRTAIALKISEIGLSDSYSSGIKEHYEGIIFMSSLAAQGNSLSYEHAINAFNGGAVGEVEIGKHQYEALPSLLAELPPSTNCTKVREFMSDGAVTYDEFFALVFSKKEWRQISAVSDAKLEAYSKAGIDAPQDANAGQAVDCSGAPKIN